MKGQRLAELDLAGWQAVLDRNAPVFSEMRQGARIGLMSKDDFEPPDATMLVWEVTDNVIETKYEPFPGFDAVKIDLLLIADDVMIRRIHDAANPNPLAEIKAKVRSREIMLFVVKPWPQLLDYGYSELLDSLGLVYLGTCR